MPIKLEFWLVFDYVTLLTTSPAESLATQLDLWCVWQLFKSNIVINHIRAQSICSVTVVISYWHQIVSCDDTPLTMAVTMATSDQLFVLCSMSTDRRLWVGEGVGRGCLGSVKTDISLRVNVPYHSHSILQYRTRSTCLFYSKAFPGLYTVSVVCLPNIL